MMPFFVKRKCLALTCNAILVADNNAGGAIKCPRQCGHPNSAPQNQPIMPWLPISPDLMKRKCGDSMVGTGGCGITHYALKTMGSNFSCKCGWIILEPMRIGPGWGKWWTPFDDETTATVSAIESRGVADAQACICVGVANACTATMHWYEAEAKRKTAERGEG